MNKLLCLEQVDGRYCNISLFNILQLLQITILVLFSCIMKACTLKKEYALYSRTFSCKTYLSL